MTWLRTKCQREALIVIIIEIVPGMFCCKGQA